MYNDEDLMSAVKAGIMTNDTVEEFRKHIAFKKDSPMVDEEYFRLLTGFNDIFVVIACSLLLLSIAWIGESISPIVGGVAQTLAAWGLAEYFTRKRRMSLPSIVLLLAFVGGVFVTVNALLEGGVGDNAAGLMLPSAAATLAAWIHWLRFKVPITIAAGAATLVMSALFLLFYFVPAVSGWTLPTVFILGILVFSLAMKWDSSDTLRQTRRSDVAFWLHLVAAPLIVHPLFSVAGIFDNTVGFWQAVLVVFLYSLMAIVAVSIDRRALMVSALIYVLYAFNTLFEQYGVVSLGFAFAALSIGVGLLILSIFWHRCRTVMIVRYPDWIQRRLPALQ